MTDESRTTEHDADRVELAALLFESADAVAHSEFILSLLIEVPAGSAHRGTADLLARAQLARLAGRHDLPPSLTGRIVSWANQVEDADSALHWLIDAEARLAVQDASVVGTLRVLANRSDWPAPVTADLVRLDLARALRLAGDVEESFAQFTRVADANDQPAFGEPRPPLFWGAWTEMLEILADDAAAGDDDGARAGRILLHLRRLALLDPELGGPSYRPRLEAVREGLER